MAKAKCTKCGGWAIADTYEQARKKINHAVALSHSSRCGDSYNRVVEIKPIVQNIATKTEKIKKKISELHTKTTEIKTESKPKIKKESKKESANKEPDKAIPFS